MRLFETFVSSIVVSKIAGLIDKQHTLFKARSDEVDKLGHRAVRSRERVLEHMVENRRIPRRYIEKESVAGPVIHQFDGALTQLIHEGNALHHSPILQGFCN